MMAAKKQNGKEQKAEQVATENAQMRTEPDGQRETTTIQIRNETKAKLEMLKGMLNQPDYNSTLTRIIDLVPQQLSNDEIVHLQMPASKYRWLMAHQNTCDCRKYLNDAKV
jgi:hypothetical protein